MRKESDFRRPHPMPVCDDCLLVNFDLPQFQCATSHMYDLSTQPATDEIDAEKSNEW